MSISFVAVVTSDVGQSWYSFLLTGLREFRHQMSPPRCKHEADQLMAFDGSRSVPFRCQLTLLPLSSSSYNTTGEPNFYLTLVENTSLSPLTYLQKPRPQKLG
jgi:hypothetical protein